MISSYKFFMTPMCPNCGEIKDFLESVKMKGEIIDASEDEGLDQARELGVMGVPTMVFLNKDGKEETRAGNMDEIKKVLENKSLLDV